MAVIALCLVGALMPILAQGLGWSAQALLVTANLARTVGGSGLLVLWGLQFALMDTDRVIRAVSLSSLLAVAIFALGVSGLPYMASVLFAGLPLLSAVFYLSVRPVLAAQQPRPLRYAPRLSFYGTRALFGSVIGLVAGLNSLRGYETLDQTSLRPLALGIGCLLLLTLVGLISFPSRFRLDNRYLPALPLLTAGLLLITFAGTNFNLVSRVAAATAWLSWIILSSIQLSGLKLKLGMPVTTLSFSEKSTVVVSWLLGFFASSTAGRWLAPDLDYAVLHSTTSIIFAYAVVLVATFVLGKYFIENAPLLTTSTAEDLHTLISLAAQRIAAQFRLTRREEEVLVLLASGRTRPYIERTLMISSGTARTHINHIHQKLGIHKQEELLDLVRKYSSTEGPHRTDPARDSRLPT
ncbi:MAG: response regulator transcription factor [Coriobacteriia bacterium]|nr:response regulator transcription factor [Coriobacteriia bacterium]